MKYQSKKDATVIAELTTEDEKFGTVNLKYLTGEQAGKSVKITNATFKRWWKKVVEVEVPDKPKEDEKNIADVLNIDYEQVNTPYPEPTEKKYVEKPQSVIDYEERNKPEKKLKPKAPKKEGASSFSPFMDDVVRLLAPVTAKVNKTYIVTKDGCWVEPKSDFVNVYATEKVKDLLAAHDMEWRDNGMKSTNGRPFVVKVETDAEFKTMVEVMLNV